MNLKVVSVVLDEQKCNNICNSSEIDNTACC